MKSLIVNLRIDLRFGIRSFKRSSINDVMLGEGVPTFVTLSLKVFVN